VAKLFLLSIIIFTTLIPIMVRTRPNPRRAVRSIQIMTVIAVFLWAYACRSCYPQYVFIE
jgi:RsiW-degrading membrane proteinase PrsW (M82 family)